MDPERTPSLRASDSDRERATEILNHALSIGQLSFDEHETRLQAALQATGVDELWRLTQDLTGTSNARPKRRSPGISLALVGGAIMAVLLAGIIGASSMVGQLHRYHEAADRRAPRCRPSPQRQRPGRFRLLLIPRSRTA